MAGIALHILAAIEDDQLALDADHAAALATALKVTPDLLFSHAPETNSRSAA